MSLKSQRLKILIRPQSIIQRCGDMKIIGISCFYHDSAAALIINGKVVAAAQEERFTRLKNDPDFPINAIKFLLSSQYLEENEIDKIIFYDKPWKKFERITETTIKFSPYSLKQFLNSIPSWLATKINFRSLLKKNIEEFLPILATKPMLFSEHHFSHAASSFYTSPFNNSAVLTIDGVGEWSTASIYHFHETGFKLLKEMKFPNSLGLLYSSFTLYCGFKVNSGEYKLMGLAPYSTNSDHVNLLVEKIKNNLLTIFSDGSIQLNLDFFSFHISDNMINAKKFTELFSYPPRPQESEVDSHYIDFAMASQIVLEEIILKMISYTKSLIDTPNLCLSGGVALNCVANSKIKNSKIFQNIWIHPSPGDSGGAIGAALGYYYSHSKFSPITDFSPYLGPEFSDETIEHYLKQKKISYKRLEQTTLLTKTAQKLYEGSVVGWFQGKMEWGPRSLGNRSILANPKIKEMQKNLNLKIKFRESFRPFAPVVLAEDVSEYFNTESASPFMQYTCEVKDVTVDDLTNVPFNQRLSKVTCSLPSITHLDKSARIQTVDQKQNKLLYDLLVKFKNLSGTSVLINTSFNVRGEPIVCTPLDALNCFLSTEIDYLVLGNIFISKADNYDKILKRDFDLD